MSDEIDLKQKISKWLENEGYPLEIYVANLLYDFGFHVTQSSYYKDYESDQYREIDVTAQISSPPGTPVMLQISYHIECKSHNKPWVLLTSDIPKEPGFGFEDILVSDLYFSLFAGLPDEKFTPEIIAKLNALPIYKSAKLSQGVVEAFSENIDTPFKAVMSAVKSAVYRIQMHNQQFEPTRGRFIGGIAFPIVVIDGKMFECTYDKKGNQKIIEVDNGLIRWNYPTPLRSQPLIRIITKDAFDEWKKILLETANLFLDIHEDNKKKLEEIGRGMSTKWLIA